MKPPALRPIDDMSGANFDPDRLESEADRLEAGRVATSDVADVRQAAKTKANTVSEHLGGLEALRCGSNFGL
jgi:hypothetical protein